MVYNTPLISYGKEKQPDEYGYFEIVNLSKRKERETSVEIYGKKINFLGDSITEGFGTSEISKVYWKQFEIYDGCVVRGYGVGGTRIARQQSGDDENQYFRQRAAVMDEDADIIVVFGGTNDYGHGDAALGKMTDRTDDTFYGALHNLYTDLLSKYPNGQIVVMTPCHRLEEERYYNYLGVRCAGTLAQYVEIIKEVAAYYSIPVLDLYRTSGMQPKSESQRKCYMPDGLHPTDIGHQLIYQRLRGFLQSI